MESADLVDHGCCGPVESSDIDRPHAPDCDCDGCPCNSCSDCGTTLRLPSPLVLAPPTPAPAVLAAPSTRAMAPTTAALASGLVVTIERPPRLV